MALADISFPINWQDKYRRSAEEIILTERELLIPGQRVLGWHDLKNAAAALPLHYHNDCIEIAFITKGNLTFRVGGQDYDLFGGDAFLTRPNVVHSTNEQPMSRGELFWLQLYIRDPNGFLFLDRPAADALIAMLERIINPCIHTDNRLVLRLVRTIAAIIQAQTENENRYLLAANIVFYLYQLLGFADLTPVCISPDIRYACEYIEQNLHDALTLQQVADEIGLSLSQFKFKFKAQIGLAPHSYINQKRIEAIKPELLQSRPFTDIAADYGFCNSAYFSVVFKKYTGLTPTDYVRQKASPNRKDAHK